MKLLVLATVVLTSSGLAAPQDYAELKDFDVSNLSAEQLRDTVQCLCSDGACNDMLSTYKQNIGMAIQEGCKRCRPSQKKTALAFFDRLQKELPEEAKKCAAKYDPQGKYFQEFYKNLKSG